MALAYTQVHPERSTGPMLAAATATSRAEVDWVAESVGRVLTQEWHAYSAASAISGRSRDRW